MKTTIGLSISALSLAMLATAALAQQYPQQSYPQQQQQGYPQQQQGNQQGYPQQGYQGNRWDAPPPDFNDINRRAFHDGMDAAHNDWQSRRPLDARRSMMFRRPPTDRMYRDQYRSSFMRGYQVAVEHRDRWMDHDHDHWGDRDRDHDNMPR
jgi:hypothetical protein